MFMFGLIVVGILTIAVENILKLALYDQKMANANYVNIPDWEQKNA